MALVAWVALAGCGGDADDRSGSVGPSSGGTGATRTAGAPTAAATSIQAKASRTAPLAERAFRVHPEPATRTQQAVIRSLQTYLDAMVVGSPPTRWSAPTCAAAPPRTCMPTPAGWSPSR